MPPSESRTGGALRRTLLIVAIAAVGLGVYGFLRIGPLLTREDPLQKADAIFVLAGTKMLRPLEAADLYREGYAPKVVMTRDFDEARAYEAIKGTGHVFLMDVDRARELFMTMGIPREAILIPDRLHDSTAAEAVTLRELAKSNGWRRIIIVTSRFHVGRARFAIKREVAGTDLEIIMHASRYDPLQPQRWWTRRGEVRWVTSEVPKLVAYMLGLGA